MGACKLDAFFKSVIDQDKAAVVICDTTHTIVYMNPAAVRRYSRAGGEGLLGRSIFECHSPRTQRVMQRILEWFQESAENNSVYEGPGTNENKDVYMVALRDGEGHMIGYYEKHEYRDTETAPKFWPLNELIDSE